MDKRVALGLFWLRGQQQKVFFSKREISRGKNKGKLVVEYLESSVKLGVFLKAITILPDDIIKEF